MDQTVRQVGSLLFFQIKTLCLSTILSFELGFRIFWTSLLGLYSSLRTRGGAKDGVLKRVNAEGLDAHDWVVIENAEESKEQTTAGKRSKTSPATPEETLSVLDASESYRLYEGLVRHHRVHPISHFFKYRVRYALVNLDTCPSWFQKSSAALHLSADEAREYARVNGAVWLLTNPVSVGYEQNPISVYYCYKDWKASPANLATCIAEVTNTPWGERVLFTFHPNGDQVPKPLHVSPFMDMSSSWTIKASPPEEKLEVTFVVRQPDLGPYFTATLQADKVIREVRHPEAFLWLMPHKVALWIYWQAFWLWWKGVALLSHPKYVDGSQ